MIWYSILVVLGMLILGRLLVGIGVDERDLGQSLRDWDAE